MSRRSGRVRQLLKLSLPTHKKRQRPLYTEHAMTNLLFRLFALQRLNGRHFPH